MKDPVFGTSVTRLTDPSMSPGAIGLRHEYARYPVVSAERTSFSKLILI